jgi:hypothetical protein
MQEMAETPVYSFDVTIEVSEDSVAVRFPFRSGTGAKQTRGTVTSFSMKPVIDKMDRDKNARDGKSKDVTDGTGKEATDDGGTGKEVTDDGGTGKEVTDGGEPFAQDVVHQRTVPGESATDGPDDSIM